MKCISFCENPRGYAYRMLINIMFDFTDSFILVERQEIALSETARRVLELLDKHKIKSLSQQSWASTMTKGAPAIVHYFHANQETKEIIIRFSKSLFDWLLPRLPDDLSFLLNGKYLMISTSHEATGCVFDIDKVITDKVLQINGLKIKEVYTAFSN